MLNNLEEKILEKIHQQKIRPLKKGVILLRQGLIWFFVALFLALSGLAFSVASVILYYGDWDIYNYLTSSLTVFVILTFPYIWFILLLVFLILAVRRLRKVKHAYRYQPSFLVLSALLFTLLSGMLFFHFGLGQKVENYLANHYLSYRKLNYMRGAWDNSQKGLLSGTIISLSSNPSSIELKDFSENIWQVNYSEKTLLNTNLVIGSKIKIIGNKAGQLNFQASEIRSWSCGCGHCSEGGGAVCAACATGVCGGDTCSN